MNRLQTAGIVATLAAALFAVPMVASAQTQGPSYCNLVTPTVRDVVQDAPAIAAVLNLDAGLSDQAITDQRNALGCGDFPAQTPDQARGEVCAVLTESRVEDLVKEINDPNATKGLETVRPALGIILSTSRNQLNCDAAPAPAATSTPVAAPAPETKTETETTTSSSTTVKNGAFDISAELTVKVNDNQDVVLDKDGNLAVVAEVANDKDCSDYATQRAAQDRLDQNKADPFNLDVDGDGIACEGLSSAVVVPQGSANTGDGSTLAA